LARWTRVQPHASPILPTRARRACLPSIRSLHVARVDRVSRLVRYRSYTVPVLTRLAPAPRLARRPSSLSSFNRAFRQPPRALARHPKSMPVHAARPIRHVRTLQPRALAFALVARPRPRPLACLPAQFRSALAFPLVISRARPHRRARACVPARQSACACSPPSRPRPCPNPLALHVRGRDSTRARTYWPANLRRARAPRPRPRTRPLSRPRPPSRKCLRQPVRTRSRICSRLSFVPDNPDPAPCPPSPPTARHRACVLHPCPRLTARSSALGTSRLRALVPFAPGARPPSSPKPSFHLPACTRAPSFRSRARVRCRACAQVRACQPWPGPRPHVSRLTHPRTIGHRACSRRTPARANARTRRGRPRGLWSTHRMCGAARRVETVHSHRRGSGARARGAARRTGSSARASRTRTRAPSSRAIRPCGRAVRVRRVSRHRVRAPAPHGCSCLVGRVRWHSHAR
jgi:hypothetical protein